MPDVKIVNLNKTIVVGYGANLRQALLFNGVSPYQGLSKYLNCHGAGSCCTCTVKVLRGDVSDPSFSETYHPLRPRGEGERLSCQVRVMGDIEIDTLQNPPVEVPASAGAGEKSA